MKPEFQRNTFVMLTLDSTPLGIARMSLPNTKSTINYSSASGANKLLSKGQRSCPSLNLGFILSPDARAETPSWMPNSI